MTVSTLHDKLFAWLDGELPPAESAQVATHVADCAECRAQADAWRGAAAAYLHPLRVRESEPFVQQVMRSIRALPDTVLAPFSLRWAFPALALSMAGFALVLLYISTTAPATGAPYMLAADPGPTIASELASVPYEDQLYGSVEDKL